MRHQCWILWLLGLRLAASSSSSHVLLSVRSRVGRCAANGADALLLLKRRGGQASQRFPPPPGPAFGVPSSTPPAWGSQHFDERPITLTPRIVSNIKTRDSRVGFIRKVYAILSVQLFVTAAVTYYFHQNRHIVRYLLSDSGSWALGLSFVTSFVTAVMLSFPQFNQKAPLNFALLGLFTGGESVFIGTIAAMYKASSVLMALAQTGVATLGLTIFSFQKNPKYDLTSFGSSLAAGLLIFASSLLVSHIFRIPIPEAAVGGVGALLFSIFLIYDTQMIVGGEGRAGQLGDKEYIRGAMEIYIDITRIFIYLLRAMGSRNSDD